MSLQSLMFNIIPFSFPSEGQTFYFSLVDTERCSRIHRSLFPNGIETIFPGIKSNGTEFICTTFDYQKEDFTFRCHCILKQRMKTSFVNFITGKLVIVLM